MTEYELTWVRPNLTKSYDRLAELERKLAFFEAMESIAALTPRTYTLSKNSSLSDLYAEVDRLTEIKQRLL
jgi:hypothetical protein